MACREQLEMGNSTLDVDSTFADGYINGNLYYYDTTHQLPRPLTRETLHAWIIENLSDQRATVRWNVGFVCGWLAALCENDPDYFFTSILLAETEPVPYATL